MPSKKRKVRIGVIGTGGIANGAHLPGYSQIPDQCEIVALCDIDPKALKTTAEKYGVKNTFEDYNKMLEMDEIDGVSVCTPNYVHCDPTIQALKAGKHVLCEKPIAMNAVEAKKMVEAAKKAKKRLQIGYNSRFALSNQLLKKYIDNGELGDVYWARAQCLRRRGIPGWGVFINKEKQGGGPLIDIGTHALDLTLWEMNNYEPAYVVGKTYRKLADTENAANAWGPWDPRKFTVEDSAFGFITMKNGATIVLEASWALNTLDVGEAKTTLCGTLGGADMNDGLRLNGEKFGKTFVTTPDLKAGGVAFYDGAAMKPEEIEAQRFYQAIEDGADPVVLPEQAYVVTQILEAIYESSKTGKPVYF